MYFLFYVRIRNIVLIKKKTHQLP